MTDLIVQDAIAWKFGLGSVVDADGILTIFAAPPPSQAEIDAAVAEYLERGDVPATVTPLQARKALRQAEHLTALEAWLDAQAAEVREEWEYATVIERGNSTLAAGALALGMTEADVDNLFRLAVTL